MSPFSIITLPLRRWALPMLMTLAALSPWRRRRDINQRATKLEFRSGAQSLGLRWRQRINNTWRHRWIKPPR